MDSWLPLVFGLFLGFVFGAGTVGVIKENNDRQHEFNMACASKGGDRFTTGDRWACVVDGKEVKIYPDGYQP